MLTKFPKDLIWVWDEISKIKIKNDSRVFALIIWKESVAIY